MTINHRSNRARSIKSIVSHQSGNSHGTGHGHRGMDGHWTMNINHDIIGDYHTLDAC